MPSLHHEVNRIDRVSGFFICDACPFTGDIDDAIEHVVVNQFNVVEPKHDNSNIKLGRSSNIDQFFRKS